MYLRIEGRPGVEVALLHPVVPVGAGDAVRRRERRVLRLEDGHRRALVADAHVAAGRERRQAAAGVVGLLVLHDQRAAVAHELQQPRVGGDERRPALGRADADHDGAVARQIARRQVVVGQQRDVEPEPADRLGHAVAAAHDVADLHRRHRQVEHARRHPRRRVEPVLLDVRVVDGLHRRVEGAAADRDLRVERVGARRDAGRRRDREGHRGAFAARREGDRRAGGRHLPAVRRPHAHDAWP